MKNIVFTIMMVLGLALFTSTAFAADATDGLGATIDATRVFSISITSSAMTVDAPSGLGPSTTEFTNSPIVVVINDNAFEPTADEVIAKAKMIALSDNQSQYGTDSVYYLSLGAVQIVSAEAENDFGGALADIGGPYAFSGLNDEHDIYKCTVADTTARNSHATFNLTLSLVVNDGKRLYGDTADSATIQFTVVDTQL